MSESTTSCVFSPLSLHHHRTARTHEPARLLQLVSERGGSTRRVSTSLRRLPQIKLRFGEHREHNKGCNLVRRASGNFWAISGHFGLRSASARFPQPYSASSRRGAESAYSADLGLSTTQVQLLVLYTPNLQIYKLLVLFVSTRSTSTQGFSDSTGTFSVLQQNRHVFS